MKETFSLIIRDRMLSITFFSFAFFLLLQILFLLLQIAKLPPFIPLFYQQPWGARQIIQKEFSLLIPGITLLFIAINIVLAKVLYKEIPLLSRILFWGNFFICLLSTISIFRIILLIS